jgi:uncharacterized protein YacL
MFIGFLHIHSLFRYIILLLLLITIFKSFGGWFGKKQYLSGDKKLALFTLISAHLQLVLGLAIYFMSAEVQFSNLSSVTREVRFFTMEHSAMMIIAIILITLGYSLAKRGKDDVTKHKRTAIFFLLALIVIFVAIPWPFHLPWSAVARGWMPGM